MEWECIVIYRKLNGVDRTIRSGERTQLELACYSLSWNHQCLPQKTTESLPNSSSGRHCPTYIELPNLHRHQSGCAVRRPAICKGNRNRNCEKKERQIAKFMYSCTFFSKPFVLLHRVDRRWSASSTNATPDLRDFRGFVCREAGSDEAWLTLLSTIAVSSQVDLPVSILPSFAFELKKKLAVTFSLLK